MKMNARRKLLGIFAMAPFLTAATSIGTREKALRRLNRIHATRLAHDACHAELNAVLVELAAFRKPGGVITPPEKAALRKFHSIYKRADIIHEELKTLEREPLG